MRDVGRLGQWLNGIWFDQEVIDREERAVADVAAEHRVQSSKAQMSPECQLQGHSFEIVVKESGDPRRVICERCGETWHIEQHT
jgi:DNA-directed RNA polymerase subunit M/transcription elongation factor TFIIS